MIKLDGTPNKGKLGANAILAVSMAVCKVRIGCFLLYQCIRWTTRAVTLTLGFRPPYDASNKVLCAGLPLLLAGVTSSGTTGPSDRPHQRVHWV